MKKIKKTNAARILDNLGIDYEIKTYEVDETDLSAVHVAETVGLDINSAKGTYIKSIYLSTTMLAEIKPGLLWR